MKYGKYIKMMNMVRICTLCCVLYLFFIYGCSSRETNPVDLFSLLPNEKFSLQQGEERLKYAKLLQPEVKGDSLMLPVTDNIPSQYVKYIKAYVNILNDYLKKMSKEDRNVVLIAFKSNSTNNTLINSYVEKKDSLFILTISKEQAISLGLESEYDEVKIFVDNLNAFLPNYSNDVIHAIEKVYEKPRSIFWNSYYLNGTINDFNCIMKSILDTNNI